MSEPFKIVEKDWGYEEWMSLTKDYCFKKIFIKKGHRTSLQYHKEKEETNYISSGKALVTLHVGVASKTLTLGEGEFIHLKPGDIHRFEALEDLILLEASSIQVQDIVRLYDDYGRAGTSD